MPALGAAGFYWWRKNIGIPSQLPSSDSREKVAIIEFSDSGTKLGMTEVRKLVRTDADWWGRLTPQQFYVTRNHTTDTPFTGTYHRMHDPGLFRCIGCDTAVFSSEAKYDSGSGWPSFWEPVANENVRTVDTPGLSREDALKSGIEVLCRRCDAHLGHIFGDGPPPSSLRYCINESSLRFVARGK